MLIARRHFDESERFLREACEALPRLSSAAALMEFGEQIDRAEVLLQHGRLAGREADPGR